MSHPTLEILGYSEAAMYVRGASRPEIRAIISIHGRREYAVEADGVTRLDLLFDDVNVPDPEEISSVCG
jgi:hypothetical protein